MESSSIPAALDGLISLCRASSSLSTVRISDGPLPQRPSEKQILIVGGSDTGDDPGVEGSQSFASLPGRERDEEFSILCTALTWSGDTNVKLLRDQAFNIIRSVEELLRPGVPGASPTLNGSVSWAGMGGPVVYSPIYTDAGSIVRVYFQIDCRQRLS